MESKQLLCAQNDDVSMLDGIDLDQLDQNGKRLTDYVLEYKSANVFAALIEKDAQRLYDLIFGRVPHSNEIVTRNPRTGETIIKVVPRSPRIKDPAVIDDLVYLSLISNKVQILEQCPDPAIGEWGIKSLKPKEHRRAEPTMPPYMRQSIEKEMTGVLTDRCFEAIADPALVTDETFEYIISHCELPKNHSKFAVKSYWVYGLPYVADKCYGAGQLGRFKKAVLAIERANKSSAGVLEKYTDGFERNKARTTRRDFDFSESVSHSYLCSFSRILEQTFSTALKRGDFDTLDRFNAINQTLRKYGMDVYVASAEDIRKRHIDFDGSLTEVEKTISKCVHNNILNTDELMEVDDEVAVKEVLDKYPIDIKEWIYDEIMAGDWPELFRFAVDRNNRALIDSATKSDAAGFKRNYIAMCPAQNRNRYGVRKSFDDEVAEIKESKKAIYEEYLFKKHGLIVNYPKERFERYYENGDYELAAIFLCTRLEVLFKDKYKLEGDMCEMIDEFAEKQKIWPQRKDLLHAIRMYRNSIVHPTNTEDADKLKNLDVKKTVRDAIDYICSLE